MAEAQTPAPEMGVEADEESEPAEEGTGKRHHLETIRKDDPTPSLMEHTMNKNLKVALIYPQFKSGFSQTTIPLNLSYLGAMLENDGFRVKGYNLNFDNLDLSTINDYDMIGITAKTAFFHNAVALAKRIKEVNKNIFIVFGGAHPTALPEETLESDYIDAVVVGEGERTIVELANSLENGKIDISTIKGLFYKKNGKIIKNKERKPIGDLDEFPLPAKHIFDIRNYPDKKRAHGDIIASRGCPFRCANCKPGLDKIAPYRVRSPEKVVDEIEYLSNRYGIKHFTFSDSELAGPKKWVLQFCNEIRNRGIRITFVCNGRTDQVSEEVLQSLHDAGCVFIGYGIESGSQKVIDEILHKGISLEQSRAVIDKTVTIGIGVGTWFMVGIPGETWDDAMKTIDYAKKVNASIVEVNIATPWPDTDFYYICKDNRWLVSENWELFNEKRAAMIETPYLSRGQVLELFDRFRAELKQSGWKNDETGTRFYHPNFLRRTIRMGFKNVLYRGIQIEDIRRLVSWLH
jgi:anaerobic magnesium-protoporphyrin IX monomethyl ester cyclase